MYLYSGWSRAQRKNQEVVDFEKEWALCAIIVQLLGHFAVEYF